MSEHATEEEDERADAFMEHLHEGNEQLSNGTDIAGELTHSDALPGLGLMGGFTGFTTGMYHMLKDPSVDAGLEMASGAKDVTFSAAKLAGYEGMEQYAKPVATVFDGASTANDIRKGDYSNAVKDGVSTGLDMYNPAVAAAWKAGWFVGENGERLASSYAADHNYLGDKRTIEQDEYDKGSTVDDWVAQHTHSDMAGRIAGAYTAAQTALDDTAYTGAHYVTDKVADGVIGEKLFKPGGAMQNELHQIQTVSEAQKLATTSPEAAKAQLQMYAAMNVSGAKETLANMEQQSAVDSAMAMSKASPDAARAQLQMYAAMGMSGASDALAELPAKAAAPAAPTAPQSENVCRPASPFGHYAD